MSQPTVVPRQRPETSAADYIGRAREIAPFLAEEGDEIDRRRELTDPVVAALVERGLFRMMLPRSVGGGELDPATYMQVLEQIGRADGSTAWCIGQNSGCSMVAAYLDPAVAREVFGGPRGILAWGPDVPNAGRCVAVAGGFRVTGQWGFASGSRHATWLGAHVPVFEADGTPRLRPDGRQLVRTMIWPRGSAKIVDNWQVLGLRGTGSDTYAVTDLFVPQRYSLGRDDPADRREPGSLYRFTSGMIYATSFSSVSLGIARGALDAFYAVARDKVPRGSRHTLRENNVIQSQVAQCEARLRSCRAYLLQTLEGMWRHAQQGEDFTLDQQVEIRLATTWAINQARDIVLTVYQAAGAAAIFNTNPFERRMRDILAGTQQGQGRAMHFETCGQILLGLEPEGRLFR